MLVGMTPSRPSSQCTRSAQPVDAERIEAALVKVAALVTSDPAFAPVFERLEAVLSRQAMALLGDARLSTEAIAALLNFHDSASFRRSFKRWTGQTPSGYRSEG
ncbi:MAG: helix-turn-helix domain-containing protein [Pseudomonadota bacterium]